MLTSVCRPAFGAALLALSCLTFATNSTRVDGAFGLRFDSPLNPEQLGASTDALLLSSVLADQPEIHPHQPMANWHAFVPGALPARLRTAHTQMLVQVSESNTPTWIVASFSSQDCSADLIWLRNVLKKKYSQPDLSIRSVTDNAMLDEHFAERLLFETRNAVVGAACGTTQNGNRWLQVEYWYRPLSSMLQQAKQRSDVASQALVVEREQAADLLRTLRGHALATTVASGSRYKIEQVFGLPMEQVVRSPGNFVVDEMFDYPLQGVAPPYHGKTAQVKLGPTGHLIRLEIQVEDPDAAEFKRLHMALEQAFAQPIKATDKHVIFRVGADHMILRKRGAKLEFTLRSGAGEKGLKSRRLAAQEKRWQEENVGI